MGLIKDITDKKGIRTSYHRLEHVSIRANGHVEMTVYSYADYSFRMFEKESADNNARYNELMSLIQAENDKPEEERNTEQVIEWSEEINSMTTQWIDLTDESNQTVIAKNTFTFDDVDITKSVSYIDAYNMLKGLEEFDGATDHID